MKYLVHYQLFEGRLPLTDNGIKVINLINNLISLIDDGMIIQYTSKYNISFSISTYGTNTNKAITNTILKSITDIEHKNQLWPIYYPVFNDTKDIASAESSCEFNLTINITSENVLFNEILQNFINIFEDLTDKYFYIERNLTKLIETPIKNIMLRYFNLLKSKPYSYYIRNNVNEKELYKIVGEEICNTKDYLKLLNNMKEFNPELYAKIKPYFKNIETATKLGEIGF